MRAIRRVDLSVGPLRVPVKMYRATESHDISLHTYHADCLGPVGTVRACKACGAEVSTEDLLKGVSMSSVITVTDEDLDRLKGEPEPVIYADHFVGLGEVDPIFWSTPYYLEPDGSQGSYVLVRQALTATKSMAVVHFNFGREAMGIVRVMSHALVLHTLHWDDEVRDMGELAIPRGGPSRTGSVRMTRELLGSMTRQFDRSVLVDGFTKRLSDLLESRDRKVLQHELHDTLNSGVI